jgi:predicted Ser/Thr protein kinase
VTILRTNVKDANVNSVSGERDERLSQLLDKLRQAGSTLQDRATLLDSHADVADEAQKLLEVEQQLQAAVGDWTFVANDDTVSRFANAGSVETVDGPGSIPASPESVPTNFGRYHIVRQLGAGGMGTVYEASDPELHRRVALKLPHFSGSPEKQKQSQGRFLREARAAAAVEHPNVCPIYDVGEQDGRPFVVMAYIEGQSLADRLHGARVVEANEAVGILLKVANGLAAVHGHGIVHRDIKPANILIRQKDGEPVLTDFGLAQMAHDDENLTADGTILGTPAYMAPEQADPSLGSATEQTDLYSLGVILFEMVTGRRPFTGSQMQIIAQVSNKFVPRASTFRPNLDATLDAIIAKATARNQNERFASAEEFAGVLAAWRNQKPRPATNAVASQAATRRPAWLVPVVMVAALGFLAVVGFAVLRDRSSNVVGPVDDGNQPVAVKPEASVPANVPPIRGAIDVQVWRKGQTDKPGMRLNHPSALPLAPGDWMRIEIELARPAYAYVVWIDTEGKASPLYPWGDSNWKSRPNEERRVQRLSLPETDNSIAPLSGGPAGIETLMLLAREEPLPADADLAALFAALPVQKAADTRAAAWFENGQLVRHEVDRGPIRLDQAKESDDPVLRTQSMLKARLEKLFPYTRGVSFANRGD